tara:strand:+ start:461 stop:649 length:189 start_codon:yes stop_codon:yes gene_type:complete
MSERVLKVKDVLDRTSLSRRSLYRRMAEGDFPSSVKLSPHRVGWRESEIEAWIAQREPASAN